MTEKEIKQLLESNMTLAFVTVTSELLHYIEPTKRGREKQIIKDINNELRTVLNNFDKVTETHMGHQAKVEATMSFFEAIVDKELKAILAMKDVDSERSESSSEQSEQEVDEKE